MRIAVDGMGGDYAPAEIIKGTVIGAREYGVDIALVGPQAVMEEELAKHDYSGLDIEIVHTDEYLIEGEHPAYTLREKRNASILLATKLVKQGRADAVIGAGPTGGVMASAMYVFGTLEEMSRPVVGGAFFGLAPNTIMMDCGANVDCQPYQFLDFAVVGTVYAKKMLNIENPTVAILSIGAEEGKGNQVVQESYPLFKKSGLNFIGNVEGCDVATGKANIVICDGFMGNVVVKFCEAMGTTVAEWLKGKIDGKLSEGEVKEITNELIVATNAADYRGGGPLWAVDGVACVSHGRSKANEISKTIGEAKLAVERDLVGSQKAELAAARSRLKTID